MKVLLLVLMVAALSFATVLDNGDHSSDLYTLDATISETGYDAYVVCMDEDIALFGVYFKGMDQNYNALGTAVSAVGSLPNAEWADFLVILFEDESYLCTVGVAKDFFYEYSRMSNEETTNWLLNNMRTDALSELSAMRAE